LTIERPDGPWQPRNADGSFAGDITTRRALIESRNVPFVRIARWCGWEVMSDHLASLGLALPAEPPPALALGAVEESPLEIAVAYTAVAGRGQVAVPRPWSWVAEPDGDELEARPAKRRRVTGAGAAYLVEDLMQGAVRGGTARPAMVRGWTVAAKTGTSSERRDAWLAGFARGVVTVVWVGRDGGAPLGVTGSQAAAPVFRDFMTRALPSRGAEPPPRPRDVVGLWVDARTGLLVRSHNPRAVEELFLESATPPRDRWWRDDEPVRVVE
jgi:membrane peptidoglycan carboxypeptidase